MGYLDRRGLSIALVCAACAPPPDREGRASQAITNGVDDDADPGVVAIVDDGVIACSGTLVSPRVVVTAAHCLVGSPDAVFFGESLELGGETIAIAAVRIAPGYDELSRTHDVGMAVLATAATAAPWPVFDGPIDDSFVGRPLRIVGFGLASATVPSSFRKRSGTARVGAVTAAELELAADPSLTCFGDSGGPAFATIGGGEVLVGVTSSGDPDCRELGRDARADLHAGFIAAYVEATRDGAAPAGGRCFHDQNCAAGTCLAPDDAPSVRYCSTACAASTDCAAGMTCAAGACRWPNSPGALGASCADDHDCDSAVCAGEPRICATRCFPQLPACDDGTACRADVAHPGALACLPAPAGCSAGSRASPGGALLVLLALLLVRQPRRVS